MNLFLTEDGVLKLGYYGLVTQADCYFSLGMYYSGRRRFAPEVVNGKNEIRSDVWSFGIALIEMMGIIPYASHDNDWLPKMSICYELPFEKDDIKSPELVDFLNKCFGKGMDKRWSVNELLNVSVM